MNNNYNRGYPDQRQMRQGGVRPEPPKKKRRGISKKSKVIIGIILVLYAVVLGVIAKIYFSKPDSADPLAVDGEYNILLLGHDKTAMLTDVIMIVNVNANDNSASVLQIPRDTYVRGVDGVSLNSCKANEVFVRHYNANKKNGEDADKAYSHALEDVAKLLGESLSLSIDGAAIMDLQGFRNIVDAIGGVEMDVPNDLVYYDEVQDLSINIKAGHRTLDGASAEGFVRFRHDYVQGDLGRVNAQKLFLTAFFNKLKGTVSITNLPTLTKLVNEIGENVVTTLSIEDMIYFAKCALKLDLEGITMMTMPGQVNSANSSQYVMNRAAMLKMINLYFNTRKEDIVSEAFDVKGMFNDPADLSVNGLYYASEDALYGGGQVFGGNDINNEGIDVPIAVPGY